jgi:hypothetical protein
VHLAILSVKSAPQGKVLAWVADLSFNEALKNGQYYLDEERL